MKKRGALALIFCLWELVLIRVNASYDWLRFETDLAPKSVYFVERFISKSRVPFRDRETSEACIFS